MRNNNYLGTKESQKQNKESKSTKKKSSDSTTKQDLSDESDLENDAEMNNLIAERAAKRSLSTVWLCQFHSSVLNKKESYALGMYNAHPWLSGGVKVLISPARK